MDIKRRNITSIMNFKRYIPDHAVTTVPVLALLVAVHYFLLRDDPVESGIEATTGAQDYYRNLQYADEADEFDIDAELERLGLDDAERDRRIRDLLHQGKFKQARTQLLEVAATSMLEDDQTRLGDTLLLLGEVAINQKELGAAELYLQEALYLTMSRDNIMGTARCYQLLGQLNIHARELARRASNTHDELWQARNSIARGFYQGVNENLQAVIRDNLEIRFDGPTFNGPIPTANEHSEMTIVGTHDENGE